MSDIESELHSLLAPMRRLLGAWEGEGDGLWQGGLHFRDSLLFSPDPHGRPIVQVHELAFGAGGEASHEEAGYLLPKEDGAVDLLVALPSGIAEVLTGRFEHDRLVLASVEIGHAPGARDVTATARRIEVDGDRLVVEVDIGVGGEAAAPHTRSVLHRA